MGVERQVPRTVRRIGSATAPLPETHALFLRREGRYAALRFLQSLTASGVLVERVSEDDEMVARAIVEQYEDKDFCYTDATSFALVRRLAIASALSFDQHFRQFGLPMP